MATLVGTMMEEQTVADLCTIELTAVGEEVAKAMDHSDRTTRTRLRSAHLRRLTALTKCFNGS